MNQILTNIDKAIEVLSATPEETFSLKYFKCGTLHCAAGHLALDPFFIEQGLELITQSDTPAFGIVRHSAMDECFGENAFEKLFATRTSGVFDGRLMADTPGMSDKQLAISRLVHYRQRVNHE